MKSALEMLWKDYLFEMGIEESAPIGRKDVAAFFDYVELFQDSFIMYLEKENKKGTCLK